MRLITLGELRLEGGDFRRPQPLLLLTYLALEGPQDRETLATLFWWGAVNPRNNLSSTLSRIRDYQSNLIDTNDTTIYTQTSIDANDFIDLIKLNQIEQAYNLYSGPFLGNIDLKKHKVTPSIEEWIFEKREEYSRILRHSLVEKAAHLLIDNNYQKAQQYSEFAWEIVKLHDFNFDDQDEIEKLLTIFYALDHPLFNQISKELNIRITDEKFRLLKSSLVVKEVPNNLPNNRTSFVGRTDDLINISQLLAKSHEKLITLHGYGGIGKTRLAIEIGQIEIKNLNFPDGIWFISVGNLLSDSELLVSILRTMQIEFSYEASFFETLVSYFQNKRVLLFLDNFDTLIDKAELLLSRLLANCKDLKLVVTTREILKLEEETIYPLKGLSLPDDELSNIKYTDYDALVLFEQRAKKINFKFKINKDNVDLVIRICKLVDGFPIGIILTAIWVSEKNLQEILETVEKDIASLKIDFKNVVSKEKTLKSVFDISWKLLSQTEQQLLTQTSIFKGGFSKEGFFKVIGELNELFRLVDKSLIMQTGSLRYDLHPLINTFLNQKLLLSKSKHRGLARKYSDYYFNLSKELNHTINLGNQKLGFKDLNVEFENISVAWSYIFEQRMHARIVDLSNMLANFLKYGGSPKRGSDLTLPVLNKLSQEGASAEVIYVLSLNASRFENNLGKFQTGKKLLKQALKHSKGVAEFKENDKVALLMDLGIVTRILGDFNKSRTYQTQAADLLKAYPQREQLACNLHHLGFLELVQGNYGEAVTLVRKSLKLDQQNKNSAGIANSFETLGRIYLFKKNPVQAKNYFNLCYEEAKNLGVTFLQGLAYEGLARVYLTSSNFHKSKTYLDMSLKILRKEQNLNDLAKIEGLYFKLCALTNKPQLGKKHLERAFVNCRKANSKSVELNLYCDFLHFLLQGIIVNEKSFCAARYIVEHKSTWFEYKKLLSQSLLKSEQVNQITTPNKSQKIKTITQLRNTVDSLLSEYSIE